MRWSLAGASKPPLGSPTTIEDRASIEHERGVWGDMLSRVLVGSQVAAWGLRAPGSPLTERIGSLGIIYLISEVIRYNISEYYLIYEMEIFVDLDIRSASPIRQGQTTIERLQSGRFPATPAGRAAGVSARSS